MKSKKGRVYFCKLCSYVATSEDELDFHYKMEHEPDTGEDLISEDDVW